LRCPCTARHKASIKKAADLSEGAAYAPIFRDANPAFFRSAIIIAHTIITVQHVNAVLGDLLAQRTLNGARHLNLCLDGQIQQTHASAVDGEFGVQSHGLVRLRSKD